jgi:uncharacterized protein (TIGR02246 family)
LGGTGCTAGSGRWGDDVTNAQFDFAGLARRYAEAWTSGDPDAVAAFYAEDGRIAINGGVPHVGRPAIAAMAEAFHDEFPGLVVHCDLARSAGTRAIFVWTLEGRHTHSANRVKAGGWEEWEVGPDGRVTASRGWFDAEDYQRQIDGA